MMRSLLLLTAAAPLAFACTNPDSDACISILSADLAAATSICNSYTATVNTAPTYTYSAYCTKSAKLSSACSCVVSAANSTATTLVTTTNASTSITAAQNISHATTAESTTSTTSAIAGSTGMVTTGSISVPASCTASVYSEISTVVKSCTALALSGISMPASSTLALTALKTGAVVVFEGNTTFGTTEDSSFNPIEIKGTDITITGAAGHIIDGNGQAYWDGNGSNGGNLKPDHFIVLDNITNGIVTNLNIQNWPTHCFDITGGDGLYINNLYLDNSAGNAPNSISRGLPAAHNSDGFGLSSTSNAVLSNTYVSNQDDCVAITSGTNITVTGMTCIGGHGLSIGSVGGKSDNTVTNITFSDSTVTNSENGCRIKTNSGTTGKITGITYQNIVLSGITDYGIDVQQNYLNGGPTGSPTNGVTITDVKFINITGSCTSSAQDLYILCGSGSCSEFTFTGLDINGGGVASSCNYPSTTCPSGINE